MVVVQPVKINPWDGFIRFIKKAGAIAVVGAVISAGSVGGLFIRQHYSTPGVTPPASGGSQFSGPFSCYGTDTSGTCYTLDTCTGGGFTVSNNAGLATALTNATAGTVICLSSSTNYGTVGVTNKTNASDIVIQPSTLSVTPTITKFDFDWSSHYRVTGVSLLTTYLEASNHITVSHSKFGGDGYWEDCQVTTSGGSCCWDPVPQACTVAHTSTNEANLFDYDDLTIIGSHTHGGSASCSSACEGRISFVGPNAQNAGTQGSTVSHSFFTTGCADGVDDQGGTGNTVGPGDEFTNMQQNPGTGACGGVHVDPIQSFIAVNLTITGDYIHNNDDGDGGFAGESGIYSSDTANHTNPPGLTFTNNVVGGTIGHIWTTGAQGALLSHNTFINGASVVPGFSHCGGTNQNQDHIVLRNNNSVQMGTASDQCGGHTPSDSFVGTFNLNLTGGTNTGSSNNVSCTPTYVASPASGYYHWQLDPTSPCGYHAASDGKSMGITP